MLTLRLTQQAESQADHYRVEVVLEGGSIPRQAVTATFAFQMTEQEREDLRWYLEEFLINPHDPAPAIAAKVERRMREIGIKLFREVFQASEDGRDLWATLRTRLDDTRIELVTGVRGAAAIPWELMRDPKTDVPLALRVPAFVRTHPRPAQTPDIPRMSGEKIRILLVICRPGGDDDVPFRSVASRLIRGLSEKDRQAFQLDVLRPPTFEELGRRLRQAKNEGKPYHVVHFDGHGTFLDVRELLENWEQKSSEEIAKLLAAAVNVDTQRFSPQVIYPQQPRQGSRGYLVFENPSSHYNLRLVDGPELGALLVETDVPVLVLNACRSAHAEDMAVPEAVGDKPQAEDTHARVRALGSLAQEVMDAGVAGVVAMRYNVYVVTAAQFVMELYGTLIQGQTLGEAVTLGRKQLANNPLREIAYEPRSLQDWSVPIVYEAQPIALFPKPTTTPTLKITLNGGAVPERGMLDSELPRVPDAGFFGRDETLLALDRAFDSEKIVLLHAFAGSGKTTTAAEFGRWYSLTGGVQGPVLFTSFERYLPLARVLDKIGQEFGNGLEQAGIHWLALSDELRRQVALQVLEQIPVLWIWDNVEPIAGFSDGQTQRWNEAEQRELVNFLRDARETKAKFLLTSRREEQEWLGNLPCRIKVPPMPMQERVQLARALADKHNKRQFVKVEDWRPLLKYAQGNPLTVTVLVNQALRQGLRTKKEIETFVSKLKTGEAELEDEESEGRCKSLGASLSYGFTHAFSEEERQQLALLHLFQGFVDMDVLRWMGDPDDEWCVPAVRGLTREAGIALLDRAADVGLLNRLGGGYYTIHPALPWYFKKLFDSYYCPEQDDNPKSNIQNPKSVARAFVEAMGELGNYYAEQYDRGNRDVIALLAAEEANLLHALPPNAVDDLAAAHNQLGLIYGDAGDLDRALSHYRESIRYCEAAGNLYGAAGTRFNVALDLARSGRLDDALLYAQAALRNFQTYGDRAAAEIQRTQRLIEQIEQALAGET